MPRDVSLTINAKELDEKSKIFNPTSRPVNKYEHAINEAAKELCAQDASLLTNRQLLLEKARKHVNDAGFVYAKGKSRSKVYGSGDESDRKKRSYMTTEVRERRIASLTDQIKSHEETISLLQKQKQQYASNSKFLQAAEINSLIGEKGTAKVKLQEELAKLSTATSQALRHQKRKLKHKSEHSKTKVKKQQVPKFFKPKEKSDESQYDGDTDILSSDSSDEADKKTNKKDSTVNQKDEVSTTNQKTTEKDYIVIAEDEISTTETKTAEKKSTVNAEEECSDKGENQNMVRPYLHSFSSNDIALYHKYAKYFLKRISCGNKVNPDLIHSWIVDLSLKEFVVARTIYCYKNHENHVNCSVCKSFIGMAEEIIEKGLCPLTVLYRQHCDQPYKTDKATPLVMQLPVTIFRLNKQLFVTEFDWEINMTKFVSFTSQLVKPEHVSHGIDKNVLKLLSELATSEKDKRLIRVAASSGMSQRTAQKELGISNVNEERARVAAAIEDLEQIKVAVNQVVESKESSSLSFLALSSSDSEESGNDTGDEDDVDAESNARSDENRDSASDSMDFESTEQTPVHSPNSNTQRSDSTISVDEFTKDQSMPSYAPSNDHLLYILRDNNLNWISFV